MYNIFFDQFSSSSACLVEFAWIYVSYFCVCVCGPSPCDPSSSALGLKPHIQGTGAAGGKARVGGSLDSTPRGVWRRKTPISKTNDVPIAHTNTQIVYQEPGGQARWQPMSAGGFLPMYFRGHAWGLKEVCGVFTVAEKEEDILVEV